MPPTDLNEMMAVPHISLQYSVINGDLSWQCKEGAIVGNVLTLLVQYETPGLPLTLTTSVPLHVRSSLSSVDVASGKAELLLSAEGAQGMVLEITSDPSRTGLKLELYFFREATLLKPPVIKDKGSAPTAMTMPTGQRDRVLPGPSMVA